MARESLHHEHLMGEIQRLLNAMSARLLLLIVDGPKAAFFLKGSIKQLHFLLNLLNFSQQVISHVLSYQYQ